MHQQRYYRLKDLASTRHSTGLLPVSPATIWRWVQFGHFPAPFKLAPQTTVWDAKAVDQFLLAQKGGEK